ncbi:hypothetical protein SAMN02927900_06307 [Rhizobium mongolense subsp. loessense]|uniref:HEPN domain-containing protein n=1 Tax=Rhizobium mongolense subsp. loessense TaxID=158890 RepID=A0A1G4UA67_9HYPH|nr:hypothetical protein SAMN02927900_06307 [Rhizobium mongolense subsp. loessense]
MRDRGIKTPVTPIIHSRREVGDALHQGQYFFSDIRKEGIVLFEVDIKELPLAKTPSTEAAYENAKLYFEDRLSDARAFLKGGKFYLSEKELRQAAFSLHQALELAYSGLLSCSTEMVSSGPLGNPSPAISPRTRFASSRAAARSTNS